MRTVWLIGHGFLGRPLSAYLSTQGYSLRTIDSNPHSRATHLADASDPSFWMQLLTETTAPDTLICSQATGGGDISSYERCYLGVLDAFCLSCKALSIPIPHIIFCSSSSVCGGKDGRCIDENSPINPLSPRAAILRRAEEIVLSHHGLVARLGALYGGERLELLRRYQQGQMPITGSPTRWLNYTLRERAIEWISSLLSQRKTGIYHLISDRLSKQQAISLMQEMTGLAIPPEETAPCSRRGGSDQQIMTLHPQFAAEGCTCMRQWLEKKLALPYEG